MKVEIKFFRTIATAMAIGFSLIVSAQTIDEAKQAFNDGITAKNVGNIEESVSQFKKVIEIGQQLFDANEDEEALGLLTQAKSIIPGMYYNAGVAKLQADSVEMGLEYMKLAIESSELYNNPETLAKAQAMIPQVHYKIAVAKYKEKNMEDALTELNKAIEADSNFAKAYYIKVAIYKTQEADDALYSNSKKGIAASVASNDKKTEDGIVKLAGPYLLKRGNDLKSSGKYKESLENLKKSLEFDNKNLDTYYLLTSVYNAQSNWEKAISSANEGLKYVMDYANEYESKLKKEGKAEIEINKEITLLIQDKNASFNFELGNAYFGKGDNVAACESYTKAAVGKYLENAKYQMEQVVKCAK